MYGAVRREGGLLEAQIWRRRLQNHLCGTKVPPTGVEGEQRELGHEQDWAAGCRLNDPQHAANEGQECLKEKKNSERRAA